VHAALYPKQDAVCQTCRGELGKAYYAIQRWVNQQENSFLTISSSNVKNGTTARFHSDQLIYTPHGLGVAYSNDNLTDKAARDILKADPDAAQHFSTLPPEAEAGEDEQPLNASQAAATKAVDKAQHPAPAQPAGLDYAKLAAAILDEQTRRAGEQPAPAPAPTDAANLTASAGGAGEGETTTEITTEVLDNGVVATTGHTETTDEDHSDEKPVRLSRMGKDQLLDTYRAELRLEPAAGLTNDELRNAIAEHRASQTDPE
jgi:hypothetical protein